MGREMRPLSAAPNQASCGQMGEVFPEYAIKAAELGLPGILTEEFSGNGRRRRTFTRRDFCYYVALEMAMQMRFARKPLKSRITPSHVLAPNDYDKVFRAKFHKKCVLREIHFI